MNEKEFLEMIADLNKMSESVLNADNADNADPHKKEFISLFTGLINQVNGHSLGIGVHATVALLDTLISELAEHKKFDLVAVTYEMLEDLKKNSPLPDSYKN